MRRTPIDLIGMKFGRLTVTGPFRNIVSGGRSRKEWKCICDCGKEAWVRFSQLGIKTNSCGCIRRDICRKGHKPFSEIVDGMKVCKTCRKSKQVLCFQVIKNVKSGLRATCKECVEVARKQRLDRPGRMEQRRARGRRDASAWRQNNRGRALARDAIGRAASKGLPSTIDPEDIQSRVERGVCELTGLPFDLSQPKGLKVRNWRSPSIDQIVPGAGYTKENVRVVLHGFNIMANTWGIGPILEVADAIRRNQYEG